MLSLERQLPEDREFLLLGHGRSESIRPPEVLDGIIRYPATASPTAFGLTQLQKRPLNRQMKAI